MMSNGLSTFVDFGNGRIRELLTFRYLLEPLSYGQPRRIQRSEVYHDFDVSDLQNPVFVSISGDYTNKKNQGWGLSRGVQYSKENPSPEICEAAKEELKKGYMVARYQEALEVYARLREYKAESV